MSLTTVTFTGPKLCDIPAFLTLPVYAYHQNRDLWGLGEESNLCVKYNTLAITTTNIQTNKKHLNIQFLPFLGNPQPPSATRKISEIKPLLSQSKVPTLITLLQSWIIRITFNLLAQGFPSLAFTVLVSFIGWLQTPPNILQHVFYATRWKTKAFLELQTKDT